MDQTQSSNMYCGLRALFLLLIQYDTWRNAGFITIQNQELLYDNFLFIGIKLHSKVMNAVSDHLFEYCKYKHNPPYCLIIQSKLKV